jgi:hypothetical protein
MRVTSKLVVGLVVVLAAMTMVGCPSKEVIVIDNYPEFSLEKLAKDVVSFFYKGSASSPLEVGDIIVGTDGGGFLRRILAVNEGSDKVATDTEDASLADAVDSGALDADVTFTPEDFAKAGVPLAKAGTTILDVSGLVIYSKDGLTVSVSRGTLDYAPTITLDAAFSGHKLQSFKASTSGPMTLDLNVKVAVTKTQTLSYETNIIPPIVKPFVFSIGPVPVVGVATLSFPFGVVGSVTGAASIESGFDATSVVTIGAELAGGDWTNLSDFGPIAFNGHEPVWKVASSAGVDVYVRAKAELSLYGCSSLNGSVIPYIAADAQILPGPQSVLVTAGINADLGYKLGVFDFTLSQKTWNFTGPSATLYSWTAPIN